MTRNLQKNRNTSCESAQETQRIHCICVSLQRRREPFLSALLGFSSCSAVHVVEKNLRTVLLLPPLVDLISFPLSHLFTSSWEDVHISFSSNRVQRVSPRRSLGCELNQ